MMQGYYLVQHLVSNETRDWAPMHQAFKFLYSPLLRNSKQPEPNLSYQLELLSKSQQKGALCAPVGDMI